MAKIDEGILGPFFGKVGEVIGSSWHGIPYIKSRPAVFHDAKSPAQLAQRMRMQVAHQFVKSIKNVITIGYRYVAGAQIPYNKAVSYIVKNVIVGEYPDMGIAPDMVIVSQGNLMGAEGCTATKEDEKIAFSWDITDEKEQSSLKEKGLSTSKENAAKHPNMRTDDTAWLVAYNFAKQEPKTVQTSRGEGHGMIEIPANWKEDGIGCYLFFASNQDDAVSDSQFLGIV